MLCLPAGAAEGTVPGGVSARRVAKHLTKPVVDLTPSDFGYGPEHIVRELAIYSSPSQSLTPEIAQQLTEALKAHPDIAFSGSADGLGGKGFQNDRGLYLLRQAFHTANINPANYVGGDRDVSREERDKFVSDSSTLNDKINNILGIKQPLFTPYAI